MSHSHYGRADSSTPHDEFADWDGPAVAGRIDPDSAVFDDLTDLFLGELEEPVPAISPETRSGARPVDRSVSPPSPVTRHMRAEHDEVAPGPDADRPVVEGLILGHLPVFASAWATEYARQRADSLGRPVGVLRVHDGHVTIDIVGQEPGGETRAARHGTVHSALRLGSELARHWIVRTNETDELSMTRSMSVDQITLLTGADETAVIGAYRTLKGLLTGGERPDPEELGDVETVVRIAMMSSAQSQRPETLAKLRDAVQTFLSIEPEVTTLAGRIDSQRPALHLFSGRDDRTAAQIIDALRGALDTGRDGHRSHADEPRANGLTVAPPPRVQSDAEPLDVDGADGLSSARESPGAAAHSRGESPDSLCSLLGGLRPLAARCPYEPDVELAIDERGAIHVLTSALSQEDPARALQRLSVVTSWVHLHGTLIRLASAPDTGGADEPEPRAHLLVEDARGVRRLLDSPVSVHVLVKSPHGASQPWCVAALN